MSEVVNDTHSLLNPTTVAEIHRVTSETEIIRLIKFARSAGLKVGVCGARHAMGAQQFASDGLLIDMTAMNKILELDVEKGIVTVEAGVNWQQLIEGLKELQSAYPIQETWVIAQKPTGADDLTLGGSLSANVHGRGLTMKPLIADVEEFSLVDAAANLQKINRTIDPDLFKLVIGGYGLFGVITKIKLKLLPFCNLERHVNVVDSSVLAQVFATRIQEGHLYGDFQFAIDSEQENFLTEGIFSSYKATETGVGSTINAKKLSMPEWQELLYLAHFNKSLAYEKYKAHYLASNGQIYASDTHQLSTYLAGYHEDLDRAHPHIGNRGQRSSEVIGEHYVPLASLHTFLTSAATILREEQADIVYGTVRLIQKDDESFLPWAKDDFACTIFNIHTVHDAAGLARTQDAFRRLIQLSLSLGGSFYLTYHRYAVREQIELCYPKFRRFLQLKLQYDPDEMFASNWWTHHKLLFSQSSSNSQI